ncbi:MAG: hypothetical protein ACP5RH_13415 [Leptodesmis sp.]|uniref:hypothetical protein n=1 Tax=Leptodesmis sp. TaxID=3100501 RepID=UPI003D14246F
MLTRTPIIRTDKWHLNPTAEQRLLFAETVKVYRRLCRHLTGIVFTHWSGKSSRHSPRSWACLCDLWTCNLQVSTDTTTSRQQVV